MMDFTPGEPIRLLPCMHYYHMRCIDDWLMRSYSCPMCMERVDVGMRDTMTTMTTPPHPTLRRRRRRRRRGERGSSSSVLSIASHGSVQAAVDICSKEHESVSRRFLVPDSGEEQLTASVGTVGSEGCGSSGQEPEWSKELVEHESNSLASSHPGSHASSHLGSSHASDHQYDIATGSSSHQPDFLTGMDDQEQEVFAASSRDHNYAMHHASQSAAACDPHYDVDQIIRISNFEVDPQEMGPFSPPFSPQSSGLPRAAPVSPPMFEYHFEYPATGDLNQHTSY